MSLYPSLEDMKVDQIIQSQQRLMASAMQAATVGLPPAGAAPSSSAPPCAYQPNVTLYPALTEYLGLDLSSAAVQHNMPAVYQSMQVAHQQPASSRQVAPVTGDSAGLRRAEIRQGVRMVLLCKDGDGKMGLRVKAVNKGVFVTFVLKNSPASLAGLRFGDQILEINGDAVAGWETDKVMNVLRKCPSNGINMAVRDRPFERTITLQRDSEGYVGMLFSDGRITHIAKDSSAARNGVLTDHHVIEVNGQNVVGMSDKELQKVFRDTPERTITITVMPSYVFEHIVKCIGGSLFKMDHSIPDL